MWYKIKSWVDHYRRSLVCWTLPLITLSPVLFLEYPPPHGNNLPKKYKLPLSHIQGNHMAVLISRPQWSNVTPVTVQEMWTSQGGNVK